MLTSLAATLALCFAGENVALRTGEVRFTPSPREHLTAEQFRLPEHVFTFEQRPVESSASKIELFTVTFPSPVVTPHPENNTVHCEYFRPATEGKVPGVVVLHILGGDFPLSRLFCRTLAHNGVAALFLKLPYYGERRPAGSPARMISLDPNDTVRGMTQGVLDIRRARAWLAAQPEIDGEQLGIFGISLGGVTSALVATQEPRFSKVCMLLAGGDMAKVGRDSPQFHKARQQWLEAGRTEEEFRNLIRSVDPITHASNVQVPGRKMLMLNVRYDEIIPRECTESLWVAFGKPEIVWWDAGHISAGRFLFDGLERVTRFFQPQGE
jgi:hypothetical protein